MEEVECTICGKTIEGYHKNHVEFLLRQHMLTHEYESKKESYLSDTTKKFTEKIEELEQTNNTQLNKQEDKQNGNDK